MKFCWTLLSWKSPGPRGTWPGPQERPHTQRILWRGRSPEDDPEELGQVRGEDTELFSRGGPITCVRVSTCVCVSMCMCVCVRERMDRVAGEKRADGRCRLHVAGPPAGAPGSPTAGKCRRGLSPPGRTHVVGEQVQLRPLGIGSPRRFGDQILWTRNLKPEHHAKRNKPGAKVGTTRFHLRGTQNGQQEKPAEDGHTAGWWRRRKRVKKVSPRGRRFDFGCEHSTVHGRCVRDCPLEAVQPY